MAGAKEKTRKQPPARSTKAPAKAKPAAKTAARPAARPVVVPKPAAAPAAVTTPTPPSGWVGVPSSPKAPRPLVRGDFVLDKLQQVALTATNLDASTEFYRDVLGLKFLARFDPPGLAFFSLGGGVRLLLSATASAAMLYFAVDDIEGAVNELKKRGVSFLHAPGLIHRDDAGDFGKKGTEEWMAFFRDPSGNVLALVERR